MILTIRTDNPEAEIGLFDQAGVKLAYEKWQAHRLLSETILGKLEELLASQNLTFKDLTGLVFYKGPGSFTGLRIGCSVTNAIVYAEKLKSVGETGDNWIEKGLKRLASGESENLVPFYGAEPHITQQKK